MSKGLGNFISSGGSLLINAADGLENIIGIFGFGFEENPRYSAVWAYNEATPVGVAALADLPIGSLCTVVTFDGSNIANGSEIFLKTGTLLTDWTELGEFGHGVIADPGDGLAIPVTKSGVVSLVSGAAETRTLAIPTYAGQRINLTMKTDVGNIVTTVASAFDTLGHTTITHNDVGDSISLFGVYSGANLVWRIENADGVLLGSAAGIGDIIADPGDAAAIPVIHKSASIAITTAAAETNTLAIPTMVGQTLSLWCDTYAVGDRVITAASAINVANNTTMTFSAVSQAIELKAVSVGGTLAWQVVANDGVTLG